MRLLSWLCDWLVLMGLFSAFESIVGTFNIDYLVSKAEIYYQRPITLGPPIELPLHKIKELPTKTNFKVVVHGFTGSRSHVSIKAIGNAYMAVGGANVLLADWSDVASLDYHSSRKSVRSVGINLGKLLEEFMIRFDIDPDEMHVIGHSLGAHIAGNIGEYFNGSLGRVTGLDPALPLFTTFSDDSLHDMAAQVVDVIHTDYPVFGDITPRGTVDFYPGFGHTPQRGCDDFDLITASKLIFEAYSCSHNRAVLLFAESIGQTKNFPSIPCNLKAIKQRDAEACLESLEATTNFDREGLDEAIANMDESQVVYMGENVSKSANGIFFLNTYDTPPYGMGVYSTF